MRTSNKLLIVGALAAAACGGGSEANDKTLPQTAQATQGGESNSVVYDAGGSCPLAVQGTTVDTQDVVGGEALVFTTSGDVPELQRRVADMAAQHNEREESGTASANDLQSGYSETPNEGGTPGAEMGGGGPVIPPAKAQTQNMSSGAKLLLTPKDPDDLEQLRERARDTAEHMRAGGCTISHEHDS